MSINLLPWQELDRIKNQTLFYKKSIASLFAVFILLFITHMYGASSIRKEMLVLRNDQKKLEFNLAQIKLLKEKIQQKNKLISEIDSVNLAKQNETSISFSN